MGKNPSGSGRKPSISEQRLKTVILGIGNLLLGDEGVGVHAALALIDESRLPKETEVLAIGTALLDALPALEKADRVIVMDAMKAGRAPGTVYRIPLNHCRRPQTIASLHGFDLSRVLTLAGRSDRPEVLVFGVEPARMCWSMELSEPVAAALPALLAAVSNVVRNANGNLTAAKFLDPVRERKPGSENLYNELDALPRNCGKGGSRADRKEIECDIERMEILLKKNGSGENYEVSCMVAPVVAKMRRFLVRRGLDEFLGLIERLFFGCPDPVLKEIVLVMMSEAGNDLLARREFLLREAHCPFFAKITLRPIKRVISRIIEEIRSSAAGQVIVYQNLRMGGLYPPMEREMRELLAAKGYPVLEIELESRLSSCSSIDEIYMRMRQLREGEDFKLAKIILTRFKVSSAPNPEDSQHPEDYVSAASQRDKFVALYALADVRFDQAGNASQQIPILMIDASKNRLSLAQEQVECSCIQVFNALDLMTLPFYHHHLYWLCAYGMDNVGDLLPAGRPGFEGGALYRSFALEVVRLLQTDADFWRSLDRTQDYFPISA